MSEVLRGPDDEKIAEALIEVVGQVVEADEKRAPAPFRDLLTLNDAWYRVPNGGYTYLLESTPHDPIRLLRDACERLGHTAALEQLDAVRRVFPGGVIPPEYEQRAPFFEAAELADDSVFYDDAVIPVIAGWAREHAAILGRFDRVVDVRPEPARLDPKATAFAAVQWLEGVSCDGTLGSDGVLRRVRMARFRRDLADLYGQLAAWRGAAQVESLSVTGTPPPYWCPIPFDAFADLVEFDAQASGLTDADVERLLCLPKLREGNVYYTPALSEAARARLRERLGAECRF